MVFWIALLGDVYFFPTTSRVNENGTVEEYSIMSGGSLTEMVDGMLDRALDLLERGNYYRAFTTLVNANLTMNQLLPMLGKDISDMDERRAKYYYIMGRLRLETGFPEKALECVRRGIELTKDFGLLMNLFQIAGGAYAKLDRMEEWEGLLENSGLPEEKRIYARLSMLFGAGKAKVSEEKYDEALEIFKRALKIALANLDEKDGYVLLAYQNLAWSYSMAGDYSNALSFYEKALNLSQKYLGRKHEKTADIYFEMATVYRNMGNYTAALNNYFASLEIRKEVLGEDHSLVASTYMDIAETFSEAKDCKNAVNFANRALEIYSRVYGDSDPETAKAYQRAAFLCRDCGAYGESLRMLDEALRILRGLYGDISYPVAYVVEEKGFVYLEAGDFRNALKTFKDSIKVFSEIEKKYKVMKGDPLDFARAYNGLASTYLSLYYRNHRKSDLRNALRYSLSALDIYREELGEGHYYTISQYMGVGQIYEMLKKYARALEYFKKSLDLSLKSFGEESRVTADAYAKIAATYVDMGKYKKALPYYLKAVAIREKVFGKSNPVVLRSYLFLADIYENLGEKEQAEKYRSMAGAVRED